MHTQSFITSVALALALTATGAMARHEERVQIWQYQDEEPLVESSLDPTVQSVRWRDGDVEILFSQAAPCGAWMPMNPDWDVEETGVVLAFDWHPRYSNAPEPTGLCKKFVRAWVFGVPQGQYTVRFSESVPRFRQHAGKVSSVTSRL